MRKKITIIGSGNVGASTALWSSLSDLGDIVLFNRTKGMAEGKALDLKQASPLQGFDLEILGTDQYHDTRDSDVVVVTAGLPRQPGMSREELFKNNAAVVAETCVQIAKFSPNAVLIMV